MMITEINIERIEVEEGEALNETKMTIIRAFQKNTDTPITIIFSSMQPIPLEVKQL